MSLFPAYAEQSECKNVDTSDKSWLENSSFQVDLIDLNNVAGSSKDTGISKSSDIENSDRKHSKIEKSAKRKKKINKNGSGDKRRVLSPAIEKNEYFDIELKGHKEYLTVKTISRPSAPTYKIKYYLTSKANTSRKKFKRYFAQVLDSKINKNESEDGIVITKRNINTVGFNDKDEHFSGFKQEEELSQKTAYFNQNLSELPNDIDMWLNYVNFQDTIHQFEKTYRKGSIAKAQRVLAERKLSIIDKALSANPDCELLHRERLRISVSAFPSDELQVQLKDLVEKDKGNIILWQGYIEATQCSMSHCNTPGVLNLYTKCLSTLHQLRRATIVEKHLLEENILKMLYQCGLFLKQAGLFEQLWVLLRMYLELNLSPNDNRKFAILSEFNEKQLFELEEVIFTSQLPLHELWLRTEKLRESSHWLPYSGDECEDPQRIVFSEDVAELIQPITVPENVFKLAATVFTLLKIPLLPCRHTTMQTLGLDYVPWSLDSVESLLAIYLPLYPVNIINKNFLNFSQLAVGPQYLKELPGKDEYLQFILKVMQNCSNSLSGDDKVSIMIWLFRFQRLLIILNKLDHIKLNTNFIKNLRKSIKDILKIEENRQNELYYLEYALIEYELGNTEHCFTIINTALDMHKNGNILTENWDNAQATRCYLYRSLIQLVLTDMNNSGKTKALVYLCYLALQKKHENITETLLNEAETKYNFITIQILINNINKTSLSHHFHPDFFTDWIMCHGWLIFLSKGPDEFNKFITRILSNLEDKNKNLLWQKEVLYEYYVAVLFKYCTDVPACGMVKLLNEVLHKAIENFPNNLFLLSVVAKQQNLICTLGPAWWKVQSLLLKSRRAFAIVFTVIILTQHITQIQGTLIDTITGEHYDVDSNSRNRMLSLFKKITSSDISTRRCGLVWRLYLQFVYSYFPPEICRKVYYSAVEECPWLKALYIDAAIYIPAELPQIQDLIIEKQLRLHVTPEELEALRS